MRLTRRAFLAGSGAAATALLAGSPKKAHGAISDAAWATMIDLTLCDGCKHLDVPACVTACKQINGDRFPEPDPEMLKPYWPQPKFEDWSGNREMTDRLTPYNWIFVQDVEVAHQGKTVSVSVPRRCMHCDNPPCVKLCPFGVMHKHKDATVTIDPFLCFGGAKCRDVCPWSIPQRQAGVGVYTYLDPLPMGGGVMYKCDLCRDRLMKGEQPGCAPACPKKAVFIGTRAEIFEQANARAMEVEGYLYGMAENGGTSTVYVSHVPFDAINEALLASAKEPKKVVQLHNPRNLIEKKKGLTWATLAAPAVGLAAAFVASSRKDDGGDK